MKIMKKMTKGLLALCLTLAVAVTMLPQMAHAEGTDVTVSTEAELNAALKDGSITDVILDTDKKVTINIANIVCTDKTLYINAPKATINISAKLGEILIWDATKVVQKKSCDDVTIADDKCTYTVNKGYTVGSLWLSRDGAKITVYANGTLEKIMMARPENLYLYGTSTKEVKVLVQSRCAGAYIKIGVKTNIETYGDLKVDVTAKGKVNKISSFNIGTKVKVNNGSKSKISVYRNGNLLRTVKAGKKEGVSEYKPEAVGKTTIVGENYNFSNIRAFTEYLYNRSIEITSETVITVGATKLIGGSDAMVSLNCEQEGDGALLYSDWYGDIKLKAYCTEMIVAGDSEDYFDYIIAFREGGMTIRFDSVQSFMASGELKIYYDDSLYIGDQLVASQDSESEGKGNLIQIGNTTLDCVGYIDGTKEIKVYGGTVIDAEKFVELLPNIGVITK